MSETILTGYTEAITPSLQKPKDYLLIFSVGVVLLVAGWLVVWSNHFASSFHTDDYPAIVSNSAAHHLYNIPRFFTNPRISSLDKDSASYRPLLSTWFALDYQILGGANPFVFQIENLLWFIAVLLAMLGLFRSIPGVSAPAAGFATLLFGLHPVIADTVNYAVKRGTLMASFGIVSGLLVFIYWPLRLPQKLPIQLKRVPEGGLDEYLRKNFKTLEARYLRLIHAPMAVYLWPVAPALLCDPATAVFAPILIAWVILFETKRDLRQTVPSVALCGFYWIFELVITRKLVPVPRPPLANYWFTQPLVTVRYFADFFAPFHLSAESGLHAFAHFWDPAAIGGYAGLAILVFLAFLTGRSVKWRAVSFGLWWFLLALVPDALIRQRTVEANWRMFLPFIGLALAVAGLVSLALERVLANEPEQAEDQPISARRLIISIAAGTVALIILGWAGWATFQRNRIWESEASLWSNAMENSPHSGRAIMNYGLTQASDRNLSSAFGYMKKAAAEAPDDPWIEINLGRANARLSRSSDAESAFKRAIDDADTYSLAWSAYGQWLLGETRVKEASDKAARAIALDPYDLTGRRTLMDILSQQHDWTKLRFFAEETLRLFPDDADGQRSLLVAQTGLDQLKKAVETAAAKPSVNNYLALSVLYYQAQRYEDCIEAARQALKVNPDSGEAYANMAAAYHTMGNLEETIAALREEVRINPSLPSAQSNLAIASEEKEARDKATQPSAAPH